MENVLKKPLKVYIKQLDRIGYLHHVESIDNSKMYAVRFKGNGGGYVSQEFKGSGLELR